MATAWKLKKSQFSQNEICHANEFYGVVLFKFSRVLELFLSSILVFSETHDCIRRLCFNARAAVRNEWEVLEENQFFSKCVYQIIEFSEVVIFKWSCVLQISWIKQNYMFERTSGCTETTESPWETQEATFYQNEIYHITKFSEIVIFKCPSVLRIVLLWQESVFLTHEWWPRNNGKYLKNLEKSFFFFFQNEIYHANGFSEVVSFRVFQCSRKRMSLIKAYVLLFKRVPRNNGKCFWN